MTDAATIAVAKAAFGGIVASLKRALKWADARKGRRFIDEAIAELVKLYPDMPRAEARVAAAAQLLGLPTDDLVRAQAMLAAAKRERVHRVKKSMKVAKKKKGEFPRRRKAPRPAKKR